MMKNRLLLVLIALVNITFAQTYSELQKVIASDREETNRFGHAVALEGNFAAIGSYAKSNSGPNRGAVYIYEKQNGVWVETQILINSDSENYDRFGWSVAMDGNYMVVGATGEDDDLSGNNTVSKAGAAYIFENQSGTWVEVQKILANDRSASDEFGWSVDIDDSTIIVGAHQDFEDENGLNPIHHAGSVYFFDLDGAGQWNQTQKVVASGRAPDINYPNGHSGEDFSDQFGHTVGISGDYVIVGALNHDWDITNSTSNWQGGAAYIFERSSGVWSEVQKIRNADNVGWDRFGSDVAIDSNIIAIGMWAEDQSVSNTDYMKNSGSIYLFVRDGSGVWNEGQKLTAGSRNSGDHFGWDVSMHGDLLISGVEHDDHDENEANPLHEAGSAYIFKRDGAGVYSQIQKIRGSDRDSLDIFGYAVAINGTNVVVGAFQQDYNLVQADSVDEAGAAYFFSSYICPATAITYNQNVSICDGDSITVGVSTYSATGVYLDSIITLEGCDSIVTTNLTVNPTIFESQSFTICEGDSITIGGSSIYKFSGVYTDSLNSTVTGCDSIVTTTLIVNNVDSVYQSFTICADDSVIVGTSTYMVTGQYTDVLQSVVTSCDSLVFTDLTVNPILTNALSFTICDGDSVLVGNSMYIVSGTFVDTLSSLVTGCDSIITTNLVVNPTINFSQIIALCDGDSLVVGTSSYFVTGTYIDTLSSTVTGCDSIVASDLTVNPTLYETQSFTICEGDSITIGGSSIYKFSGVYTDSLNSTVTGCDSIVTTTLVVNNVDSVYQSITICADDSIVVGTSIYALTGQYTDVLQSVVTGCDSLVFSDLTVNPILTNTLSFTICEGDSVVIGNSSYTLSGTYIDTLSSLVTGCDSIITTNLVVNPTINYSQIISLCDGDSLNVGSSSYFVTGTYTDTLSSTVTGCDSIVASDITVHLILTTSQTINLCGTDTYTIGNSTYDTAGVYLDTLSSILTGCDSLVSTTIIVGEPFEISQNISICYGESYSIGNSVYSVPGNYIDTLAMISGSCDSIVNTSLTIAAPIDQSLNANGNSIESNQDNAIYQWVDCDNNYQALTGTNTTSQEYEATQSGNYGVIINLNNCMDTSACVFVDYVGVEEYTQTIISLYPNPNSGRFVLNTNGSDQILSVNVLSLNGRLISSKDNIYNNEVSVNLENYSKGVYLVEVILVQDAKQILKLIIE